jgi:integrase
MKKFPKPWYRGSRGVWYVTLDGVQHNLGSDKATAFEQYKKLLANPETPQEGGTLFEDIAVEFITWCKPRRSPETVKLYKERIESFLEHAGNITIEALTPLHLDQWVDSHPNWADGTKRNSMAPVQRCLNWAVKKGKIKFSPIALIDKPSAGQRDLLITPEIHQQLLSKVRDAPFRELLTISWETGARPQESLVVEAHHVDLENGTWTFPIKESKGKKRSRVIWLNDIALEMTKALVKKHPSGPLLRNRSGNPWTPWSVNNRFCRLQKKLGVKYCLYLYRHAWVSRKLIAGVDSHVVAKLAGHVSTQMIDRVYSKISSNSVFMRKEAGRE